MVIKHRGNTHKGVFYIEEGNKMLAEISYSFAGADKMLLDQTTINNELPEQNEAGSELLDALINYSRDKNIKVIPLCIIAKSIIEQNPAYRDVLFKQT
ncbi:N-acetyltransferase [Daejeonella sp. H1SJ63]|jgi:hypothetical protein|uniref:GNAT family N-acetyltransferase n=1 Tax=Daejeonella sp. H1SJ63 TaxID=3034145 RepID=UPI0023ED0788|nr:N-acetyltransferase [Daejeonella sp. H1SJ63]